MTTLALAATAAAEPAKPATTSTEKAEKPPAVAPEAIAALDKMGAFLREQKNFTVRVAIETDHVLDNGQMIRVGGTGEMKVRRPDHLRMDLVRDRKDRQFFYDGKTFTMNAPKLGVYAAVSAPATIEELADQLEDRFDLQLPLVDLFRWGTDESDKGAITSAVYIGPSKVGGVDADQYAFRQKGLDWQVWIQRGDQPLPLKVVLTTTDDPKRPQHEIAMTWSLDTKHEDSAFMFVPDKKSHPIALNEARNPKQD
jgi:hypothetical protein